LKIQKTNKRYVNTLSITIKKKDSNKRILLLQGCILGWQKWRLSYICQW